ncbi:uncharacterized protein METZ01_LOCUS197102, partial [marine metagenome]
TNVNTSTSSNTNTNTSNNTNTNNNTNTSTSDNTNTNNNTNTSTSKNTNQNINTNNNNSTSDSNVKTDNKNVNESTSANTNKNYNKSESTQTINQNIKQEAPPASAIAPSIMSYSQDLCTVGRSGAFQGQLFGISGGKTVTDENCERLKLSKYIYDMGMKVAAVALLCQDVRVFKAMEMAGTPCPYKGEIGGKASSAWVDTANISERPDIVEYKAKLKKDAKTNKREKRKQAKKDKADKKIEDKAAKEAEKAAKVAEKAVYNDFIAVCTLEANPSREKIKRDVVGAVATIVTPRTKTTKQCAKEYEKASSNS